MTVDVLRLELLELLGGQGARMPFEAAVAAFPDDAINQRAPNVACTPWHLLEHIRLAQHDLLAYVREREYLAPAWPDEYWPAPHATATPDDFARTVAAIQAEQRAFHDLVADATTDVLAVIPGTPGHTILREVRLLADHTAFHLGEFAILRQVMGTWPPGREE
jgi:DinB superfamily